MLRGNREDHDTMDTMDTTDNRTADSIYEADEEDKVHTISGNNEMIGGSIVEESTGLDNEVGMDSIQDTTLIINQEEVVSGEPSISSTISTTIDAAVSVQKNPEVVKRNKRMFGALMGHLGSAKRCLDHDISLGSSSLLIKQMAKEGEVKIKNNDMSRRILEMKVNKVAGEERILSHEYTTL
jgi:hypothetical protein